MRRQILVLLLLALVLTSGLMVAGSGCASSGTGGTATSDTSTTIATAAESLSTPSTESPGEGLRRAKLTLTQIVNVPVAGMQVSSEAPGSPVADAVLEWQGGKAEVDSTTGRIYIVSIDQTQTSSVAAFMSAPQLELAARRIVTGLGWTDGMLAGLGFKQEQPGILAQDTGLYTLAWSEYDSQGAPEDGHVEVRLDGRNGSLVGFSVSPSGQRPDIAGAISEGAAMDIAETEIYLETNQPKISLAGDGSLILLDKRVSEELKVINDQKITKRAPLLAWVITVTGTVEDQPVGGTVYIDATTGEVLKYVAEPTKN